MQKLWLALGTGP